MKNLAFLFLAVFAFAFNSTSNAQQMASADQVVYSKTTGEVEILSNFKATKNQKKVISKIQKYVTPRIFDQNANTGALAGKAVKIQVNFNANGTVSNVAVVNGIAPKLDDKVIVLVKEFNSQNAISNSNMKTPSAIQLDIDLVGKKYFIN